MRPTAERRIAARCPACSSAGLHEINFRMKNGDSAQLRRCSNCEWRNWYCNGKAMSLAELLDAVNSAGLPNAPRRRRAG